MFYLNGIGPLFPLALPLSLFFAQIDKNKPRVIA